MRWMEVHVKLCLILSVNLDAEMTVEESINFPRHPTLIPDEGPLLETSNLFVSLKNFCCFLMLLSATYTGHILKLEAVILRGQYNILQSGRVDRKNLFVAQRNLTK